VLVLVLAPVLVLVLALALALVVCVGLDASHSGGIWRSRRARWWMDAMERELSGWMDTRR
jgi:hypothetical protein